MPGYPKSEFLKTVFVTSVHADLSFIRLQKLITKFHELPFFLTVRIIAITLFLLNYFNLLQAQDTSLVKGIHLPKVGWLWTK